jgi:hypothetical protein
VLAGQPRAPSARRKPVNNVEGYKSERVKKVEGSKKLKGSKKFEGTKKLKGHIFYPSVKK